MSRPAPAPTGDRQRVAAFARRVVSLARLAPSVHNTQPWLFRAEDDVIELWADPARRLPVVDPTGRELVVSCGAALLHARLAVASGGRDCTVEAFPSREHPDHLATLHLGQRREPTAVERALTDAARRRHTARGPFEERPVPAPVPRRLCAAAWEEGVTLHLVPDDDRVLVAVLLDHADRRQAADPAYAAELRAWVRTAGSARDGVPPGAAAEADTRGRHTDLRLRRFGEPEGPRVPAARGPGDGGAVDERPLLAVLLSDGDTRADWLAAGQGLARLLLVGALEGVAGSPLGQVVDDPGPRARLRRELRLLGHPQVVLRLGYGTGAGAPRRDVDDVLVVRPAATP